jgi:alpha/beta superfamily hydrolase
MDTAIVRRIAQTLSERGCAALRFNFRGVGRSQGHYDEGRGEIDDMVGALDALAKVSSERWIDTERLGVIGYSFGAWIAGQAVTRDERIRAYVAIALPMDQGYCVDLGGFSGPKYFITGAQDTISAPELLRKFVGSLSEPKTLAVIPGADHFLLGHEQGIADHVTGFLLSALNNPAITEKHQSGAHGLSSQGGGRWLIC